MWSSLWLVPLLCLAGDILLSLCNLAVDRRYDHQLVPHSLTGGPGAAQSMPIVRSLLQDRPSQLAIGPFAATFAHTLTPTPCSTCARSTTSAAWSPACRSWWRSA